MSFTLHGIGVCGGIAIGHAHLVSHATLEVAHYAVPLRHVDAEIARFDAAVLHVRDELQLIADGIAPGAPAEFGAILQLHGMMLDDPALSEAPRELIRERQCNAEWALVQQMDLLVEQFDDVEDAYLRERKADVVQLVERVLKSLLGHPGHSPAPQGRPESLILVAHDLSPADVILFKQHHFAGFVTDVGGTTSHTAILARSLNMPAIVALHHARQMIREDELIIIDGTQGVLIVDPDKSVLTEYRLLQGEFALERKKLRRLKTTPSATLEGEPVELAANIELPEDVADVHEAGGQGIGLFRSEFLFLNRDDMPGEDEQFEAYRRVVQDMDGLPVTIRTLDLGADKTLNGADRSLTNPALGLRAIRLCLAEPQMFLTQLRAILRASQYGKVRLLIPMLAALHEIDQALALITQARETLTLQGVAYDAALPIGGMVEVPAAVLVLKSFMRRLDFLSIGTNDLIQYTLAIDRTDESVAHLYDPLHPAVLQLIATTIKVAGRAGIPVAVCGEMAGEMSLTRLLLGFGLRHFSMHPAQLLGVKQQVLKSSLQDIKPIVSKILHSEEPERIRELLAKLNA